MLLLSVGPIMKLGRLSKQGSAQLFVVEPLLQIQRGRNKPDCGFLLPVIHNNNLTKNSALIRERVDNNRQEVILPRSISYDLFNGKPTLMRILFRVNFISDLCRLI